QARRHVVLHRWRFRVLRRSITSGYASHDRFDCFDMNAVWLAFHQRHFREDRMGARTGQQFLRGLRDRRELWVGGDKVLSMVDHPALAGAAQALAEVYDLQHQAADVCLMPDPETGEPINVSHMIPHGADDLQRRHRGLERIAEYSVGLMGRTPDYMNVT